MESTIKVMSTPNIMRKAFADECRLCSIRNMETIDLKDPAPDMPDDEWNARYSDTEMVYKVRVRYSEVPTPLYEKCVYSSWENVLKAIKKRRLKR